LNQIIEKLKKKGFWVVGLGMEGSTNLWDYKFDTPTALVIGWRGRWYATKNR
jgi:23S rRNA (guanosine2251-2'-O)-methyltransferase